MRRIVPALILLIGLVACGSFRGPGRFKTSSEYVGGMESLVAPGTTNQGSPVLNWPVGRVRISRGFHPETDPGHQGLDLTGPLGTPILAAHAGRVLYAGRDFRGYGNMIILERDSRLATLYAHLSRIQVTEGLEVNAGDRIGLMGSTGKSTGVHLHFEVLERRQPINPIAKLPGAIRGLTAASKQ